MRAFRCGPVRLTGAILLLTVAAACGTDETPSSGSTSAETSTSSSSPDFITNETVTTPGSALTTTTTSTTISPTTTVGTTTTTAAATTTVAATTTTAVVTTTTVPPAPCGVPPPIPAGALEVNSVVLDSIGDGVADDTVTSYFDPATSQWRLRNDVGQGWSSEIEVPGVGAGLAKVLGAVEVDGGGADEILAIAGAGAATSNLGVFAADSDGCLFRFQDGGAALEIPVGATVTRQDGLVCTGSALSLRSAEDAGGGLWNVTNATLGRTSLTELTTVASSIVGGVATADLGDIATLDCAGLSL